MARSSHTGGRGPSQRQLRVGELIRRRLSEMLQRGDLHDPAIGRMSITVGEVRVSPDLRVATAYVLPLGGEGKEDAIAALAANAGELRRGIGQTLGLKHTPELRFLPDDTFDQMDATRALLDDPRVKRDLDG